MESRLLTCQRCGESVRTLHVVRDRNGNREWVCPDCMRGDESSMFMVPKVAGDATSIARRSDALHDDKSGAVTRRWLCDRVARLEAALNGRKP